VTSFAASLESALADAYNAASKIRFEGMHYRSDIGGGAGKAKSAGD
jgi:phosphoribosylamine-glycine ligase